ncbi:MAG: UDP-N-acetylmuramoyl-tripeptide--D-alanyl-D-alanine ligase [Lachnospiraceae bacterium]|nr:UDP-N-acetylmuramoyl-tripeptide--D-alanyl-D-alanine ligase [Lachnospiraceae bacterium]MDY5742341.1 UDP-N-acetylmuramoyl-tripeptide--D-alanyl-D-alanine ligase [Lachnospiraceae bacterium]
MQMTIAQIRAAIGGTFSGEIDQNTILETVSTDSRIAFTDGVFVAIPGERVDGHEYIGQAFAAGAVLAIGEQPLTIELPGGHAYLQVAQSVTALQQLAAAYRKLLAAPIIGISGSVGKTSTKEMIAAILGHTHKIGKTMGNLNNEIGVPLTLLSFAPDIEFGIVEMGISGFGEMELLSRIVRPDICVLTNIGDCHLEALGDREGVKRAKTEMFTYMNRRGRVYLNGDDPLLAVISEVHGRPVIHFGLTAGNDCVAVDISGRGLLGSSARLCYRGHEIQAEIPIAGVHMVQNTAVATAIGIDLGLNDRDIEDGIAAARTISGRSHQITVGKTTVIDDCYNANPMSMKAALAMLADSRGSRRIAVLGDMFELGADEIALHESVGTAASSLNIDRIYCIGSLAAHIAAGLRRFGFAGDVVTAERSEAVLADILRERTAGAIILVKASHGMNFAGIVKALQTE